MKPGFIITHVINFIKNDKKKTVVILLSGKPFTQKGN
jgi:hypothetical protein